MGCIGKTNKAISPVILLTSSVNPCGMYETNLIDKDLRYQQYCASIEYLLRSTNFKIVVVDNTNVDYSQKFKDSRLEVLFFDGNHFNKNYGKGYGEVEIMLYAFKYSSFIASSEYIIKLTGRTPLINIKGYFYFYNIKKDVVLLDIPYKNTLKFCYSRVIFAPKSFYSDYFFKGVLNINDSLGYFFENHLYNCVDRALHDKSIKLKLVIFPFIFKGISGTSGKKLSVGIMQILRTFIGSIILNYNIKHGFIKK